MAEKKKEQNNETKKSALTREKKKIQNAGPDDLKGERLSSLRTLRAKAHSSTTLSNNRREHFRLKGGLSETYGEKIKESKYSTSATPKEKENSPPKTSLLEKARQTRRMSRGAGTEREIKKFTRRKRGKQKKQQDLQE